MAQIDTYRFGSKAVEELRNSEHYGKRIGENWPVVYIMNNDKEAYVGETHHASVRMAQHLTNPDRRRMKELRVISDSDFNKSVILDLESFLIKHMGSDGKYKLQNGNHGLQDHDYYNRTEYEENFRKIWNMLKSKGVVNHSITEIENSTLYKYSPYKTLGAEQMEAEIQILNAFANQREKDNGVSIIVKGGAGTGKTILAIYLMKLFADINNRAINGVDINDYFDDDIESIVATESLEGITKIGIVMPQTTLKKSIQDVFKSISSLNKKMVVGTTEVVEEYRKSGEKYDLLIVDEAHRLKCRWKGHLSSYPKFDECNEYLGIKKEEGNELDWIMKCSKHQIFFRDELQTVRPCDLDGAEFNSIIAKYHPETIEIPLYTQWRCQGGTNYIDYVKNILGTRDQKKRQFENYEFKMYRNVDNMVNSIKKLDKQYGLCRNAAGYAWKWISKKKQNRHLYDIEIQGNKYRWNTVYENWIATESSIDEIGCIHTLQGYDLNYVGLIIGDDIVYDKESNQIKAVKANYQDQQGKSGITDNPEALKEYLTNIYLTLMTRGIKGTYVYVCDDGLRQYFERYVDYAD